MSTNEHTGDRLISKIGNPEAYSIGYDSIFNKPLDISMGITNTEWCSHGQHYAKSENITWIEVGKTGRRKLCFACKAKIDEAKKAARLGNNG
jgi:hypothetical protein